MDVVAHKQGADPASVAFDGVKAALNRDVDILLIDTAGRLHNKSELMDELGKIKRVIKKDLPEAPHETWIVVDSTTGQNASQQVKAFSEVVDLSGIVVTKLDGTAKGGVGVEPQMPARSGATDHLITCPFGAFGRVVLTVIRRKIVEHEVVGRMNGY